MILQRPLFSQLRLTVIFLTVITEIINIPLYVYEIYCKAQWLLQRFYAKMYNKCNSALLKTN